MVNLAGNCIILQEHYFAMISRIYFAQSAGAAEYTDCFSAEG